MKILAIRGRNLASLAGDFEVDLRKPPLGQAGLFAITGPTGAGKSTLLDTVCLALFGTTPRLEGRSVRVGLDPEGEMLSSGDARSILRKGTAEGCAEVDFLGQDDVAYRARWEVHRARGRAGGRLADADMRLVSLPDLTRIGRTKTEVVEAIKRILGFDFKQFRRSVLLAQGDFAAFLSVAPGDRTDLLERITGAEVYKELSIAAHKRAVEEKDRLEHLMDRQEDIRVLSEAERAALARTIHEQEAAVADARRREGEAAAAQRWHDQHTTLAQRVEDARKKEDEARRAWDGSQAERAELDACRAAQPLRTSLERADDADGKEKRAREVHRKRGEELGEARDDLERALIAMNGARELLARARTERESASEPLALARQLDGRIVEAFKEQRKSEEAAREADELSRKQEAIAAVALREFEAALHGSQEAEEWLRANAAIEAVAKDWALWNDTFERLLAADTKRASLGTKLPGLSAKVQKARDALAEAVETQAKAALQSKKAAEDRARAEKAAEGLPRKQYKEELGELRHRRDPTGRMKDLIPVIVELAKDLQTALAASSIVASEAMAADAEAADAARQLAEIETTIETAERDLRRHLQAASLEDQRHLLEAGKPCPLCGSPDHPWAEAGVPSADLQALKSRVEGLKGERERQAGRRAAAQARGDEMRRKVGEEAARAAQAEERLDQRRKAWAVERGRLTDGGIPVDPLAPSAVDCVAAAILRLDARIEEIAGLDKLAEEAEAAATRARGQENKTLVALNEAHGRMTEARSLSTISDAAEKECRDEIGRLQDDRRKAVADLSQAFQAWPDAPARLDRDPSGFRAARVAEVDEWNARQREKETTAQRINGLRVKACSEEAARDALVSAAQRAKEEHAVRCGSHADLTREREGILDGRGADEVQRALDAALQSASDAHEKARKAHGDSEQASNTASAREADARKAIETAGEDRRKAHAELEAELKAKGLDMETLRRLVSHDEAWIGAREAAHRSLRQGLDGAVAVLGERRDLLKHNETLGRPALGAEEAASASRAAARDLELAQDTLQTVKVERQRDLQAQKDLGELMPQIERQAKTNDLWQKMRELIGSADGVKFSRFAQGLTFEVLLERANHQLEALTRRYRLLRVPGFDLEFQVSDLDMGNEVRGVSSLSGGETFLVSLGLALGLSSLSSRQMRVGSLFIDEGFGTLDPETLDMAISALEALGGADRQVGIISHVSGLADRIGAQVRVIRQGQGRSSVKVDQA